MRENRGRAPEINEWGVGLSLNLQRGTFHVGTLQRYYKRFFDPLTYVGTIQRHYKKISDPLEEISGQKGRKSLPEGRKFQLFGNLYVGVMCIHIMACITDRDLTYH